MIHPTFAALLSAATPPSVHRGWPIRYNALPHKLRQYRFIAEHPLFDGMEADDRIFHGPTREAVIAQVDAWLAEEVEL